MQITPEGLAPEAKIYRRCQTQCHQMDRRFNAKEREIPLGIL